MTRTNERGDENGYLFVVAYEDDAERKRVEYLFNNWDEGDIEKPAGLVRLAANVDHDELYERLVGKVPEQQVDSYRIERVEPDVTEDRRTVEQHVDADAEVVESFVEYVLSKKNAVLQSASRNEYEVYTKKGRGDVTYRLDDSGDGTTVEMTVEGYPPAPEFLAEFFRTELADYAGSQR